MAKLYGFSYQPFWSVVAKDGTLIRAAFGPSGEDELVSTIRALVEREKPEDIMECGATNPEASELSLGS